MKDSLGTTDTLHVSQPLELDQRKLSQEKLMPATYDRYHNDADKMPTTKPCTCRKLLSRQPHIRRTCGCGSNNREQRTSIPSSDTKQYLENSTTRTDDYHPQHCNNTNPKTYPHISLETHSGDNHIQQKSPKMLDESTGHKTHESVNNNNNNHGNHINTNGNGSDEDEKRKGSHNDFNFEDIDLEAATYPEEVFWCLHRKSRWRHWAIRMTQSPYPFQTVIMIMTRVTNNFFIP